LVIFPDRHLFGGSFHLAALFDGFYEPTPVYHQKPTTESII